MDAILPSSVLLFLFLSSLSLSTDCLTRISRAIQGVHLFLLGSFIFAHLDYFVLVCDICPHVLRGSSMFIFLSKIWGTKSAQTTKLQCPSLRNKRCIISVCGENLAQLFDGSHVGPQKTCEICRKPTKNVSNLKIASKYLMARAC